MKLLLATIALNEAHWLPDLFLQHRAWPADSLTWCFVESADRVYAQTNPDMVSPAGLSVDGTTAYLADLASRHPGVVYIPHGFCSHHNPAQGKVQARQRYLDVAAEVKPDWVLVLDADEMYTLTHQQRITDILARAPAHVCAVMFRQRHIWRPASIQDQSLFSLEVQGGYWSVPHCRAWRWEPGLCYRQNHNWPEDRHGTLLTRKGFTRYDKVPGMPECVHLGFASSLQSRQAKHAYYQARGEGREAHPRLRRVRSMYVDCRRSWQEYRPGDTLPHNARVVPYQGPVPECFACQAVCSLSSTTGSAPATSRG